MAAARRPYKVTDSGLYVARVAHPVTGTPVRISSRDPSSVITRARYLRELRRELHTRGNCPHCGGELYGPRVTPDEAAAFVEEARASNPARLAPWSLRAAWSSYERAAKPETRRVLASVWRNQMEPFLPLTSPLARLTAPTVEEWFSALKAEGYATKTVRSAFWLLAACVRRAATLGRAPAMLPWGETRPPRAQRRKRPEVLTAAELERLIAYVSIDDKERARLIAFAALTGMRNGELAALGWDDLDLDAGTLTVRHQALDEWRKLYPGKTRPDFPTKGRGEHTQQLHPQALAAAIAQRSALAAEGLYDARGPVWPDERGTWRPNGQALRSSTLVALAKRAGLAIHVTPHTLRHTFVTLELRGGGDVLSTQSRVGHSSPRVTEQYAHAPPLAVTSIAQINLPSLAETED